MFSNPLLQLQEQGQSIWIDFISRDLLRSGKLERLIKEDGLRGLTSNPTIFDNAISKSSAYDEELHQLAAEGKSPVEIYEALALADIAEAADLMRPVYDEAEGRDGFVSIEVSPHLAHDTEGTVAEARRLFEALDRPNIMIKVPGTLEGIPAIEELIAAGININVTLLFSIENYKDVAEAYIRGLERRHEEDEPLDHVASVASFFVSRVDTAADKELERIGTDDALALRGQAAVANAKLAYAHFQHAFNSLRFGKLQRAGAQVQRPLWASTSTKNPEFPDVKYVEELIGLNTVNTMPPQTLDAFRDHGVVLPTVMIGIINAGVLLDNVRKAGVDFDAVTEKLQHEGVKAFADSFDSLLASIEEKAKQLEPSTV